MLKALTFLGLGPKDGYQETTYHKVDDKTANCKTHLFTKAVAEIYQPNKTILFVTPEVEKDEEGYLRYLKGKLRDEFDTVSIPNGDSEMKLWDIFNACENAVEEGDKIILDITHAFRSIPLLIFIVAAYLRQVKSVELEHIIYGAFEARNSETNETPIFDLTPFVNLLDWMNAVNVFQNYGDAREIAKLGVPNSIKQKLTNISAALLTNRTFEAQKEIHGFSGMSMNHPEYLKRQPDQFRVLTEKLKVSYVEMGVKDPHNNQDQSLTAQYKQIEWYMENQHYLQAITLMREWIVSWECLRLKKQNWLNLDIREYAEDKLNKRREEKTPDCILWRTCGDLRNDLAHCGMREDPSRSNRAIENTKGLFKDFKEFVRNEDFA